VSLPRLKKRRLRADHEGKINHVLRERHHGRESGGASRSTGKSREEPRGVTLRFMALSSRCRILRLPQGQRGHGHVLVRGIVQAVLHEKTGLVISFTQKTVSLDTVCASRSNVEDFLRTGSGAWGTRAAP